MILVEHVPGIRLRVAVVGLRIQHPGVAGANRQRQALFDRVDEDEVSQYMAFHGKQEGMAAALQALEQVGSAEAHQPLAGAGKIIERKLFRGCRRGGIEDVVAEAVAGQVQAVDGAYHVVREQLGVLATCLHLDGLRHAGGKRRLAAIGEQQVFAAASIRFGVVGLDEAARSANQVQAHQFAPVFRVFGMFEGSDGAGGGLMPADELRLAHLAQQPLRADAEILALAHEQPQLAGEILIGLVVGRGGEQDALAVVLLYVLLNRTVALAGTVAQIVALVDEHDAIAAHVAELALYAADGEHTPSQPVPVPVVFPHRHQVLGADDERLQPVVVL